MTIQNSYKRCGNCGDFLDNNDNYFIGEITEEMINNDKVELSICESYSDVILKEMIESERRLNQEQEYWDNFFIENFR